MNSILRVFQNTSMINGHDGLSRIALKYKVRLDQLGAGEHVLFLNRALNKIKMYSANGVLSYYRHKSGKINLHIIEQIPVCFSANGGMNWKEAERLALDKMLLKQSKVKSGDLAKPIG